MLRHFKICFNQYEKIIFDTLNTVVLIALKVQVYIILIFWMLLQLKLRTANAERAQWR